MNYSPKGGNDYFRNKESDGVYIWAYSILSLYFRILVTAIKYMFLLEYILEKLTLTCKSINWLCCLISETILFV